MRQKLNFPSRSSSIPRSGHMRIARWFAFAVCLFVVYETTLRKQATAGLLDRVGVMGDSLSSEYLGGLSDQTVLGETYSPYKSWVEQLVEARAINFGSYGDHGFFADLGYEYNRASVLNTTARELLRQSQHTILASKNPTLAVLMVGGNDFQFHAQNHNIIGGVFDGEDPNVLVSGMLGRFRLAMETVAGTASNPTGTQMVLGTIPDITRVPLIQELAQFNLLFPGAVDRYRAAIAAFNQGVVEMAAERNFAVMDINLGLEEVLGPPEAPVASYFLGGNEFTLNFGSPSALTDLFLHDGFHPNSFLHGLIAREFIDVVNRHYGANIAPLSDREIVEMAGLEFVPEPSSLALSLASLPLLIVLVMRRKGLLVRDGHASGQTGDMQH